MINIGEDGINMAGDVGSIVNECLNIIANTKYFLLNSGEQKELVEYLDNKFKIEAIKLLACKNTKALKVVGFDFDDIDFESKDID